MLHCANEKVDIRCSALTRFSGQMSVLEKSKHRAWQIATYLISNRIKTVYLQKYIAC